MERANFYNLISNPNLLNSDTLSELKELTQKYPHFQMGWILYLKNLKMLNDENFEKVLNEVAIKIPDRKQLFLYLNDLEEIKPFFSGQQHVATTTYQLEGDTSQAAKNPLIDKFLTVNVNPLNFATDENEEDSTENIDNETGDNPINTDDSEDFVTETLAMLYYKQKKYDEAISAFKNLSLKYPEKNVYFATRIEEIEKLKNL